MRRSKRLSDLAANPKNLLNRERPGGETLPQRLAGDEFHHQTIGSARVFQPMNRRDVGMVQ